MSGRIRTIKPELFRHEGLQDLQLTTNIPVMLVFVGLFTHADREGRFKWSARQLKLDILPFIPFDMEEALELLRKNGFIRKYESDGQAFGYFPTWKHHQVVNHREIASRIPEPPVEDACGTREPRVSDASTTRELRVTDLPGHARGELELELEGKGNDACASSPDGDGLFSSENPEDELLPAESVKKKKTDHRAAVSEVFAYYLEKTERNPRTYTLTEKRMKKGLTCFEECFRRSGDTSNAVSLMKIAIDGIASSDFHMGRDPKTRGKRYCEWEDHCFADVETMEKWWASVDQPGGYVA
jgi:hypothetical protein